MNAPAPPIKHAAGAIIAASHGTAAAQESERTANGPPRIDAPIPLIIGQAPRITCLDLRWPRWLPVPELWPLLEHAALTINPDARAEADPDARVLGTLRSVGSRCLGNSRSIYARIEEGTLARLPQGLAERLLVGAMTTPPVQLRGLCVSAMCDAELLEREIECGLVRTLLRRAGSLRVESSATGGPTLKVGTGADGAVLRMGTLPASGGSRRAVALSVRVEASRLTMPLVFRPGAPLADHIAQVVMGTALQRFETSELAALVPGLRAALSNIFNRLEESVSRLERPRCAAA